MPQDLAQLLDHLWQKIELFLIIEARLGALFAVVFIFRREWIPTRILVATIIVLSLFILNTKNIILTDAEKTPYMMFSMLAIQLFSGLILGLIINFFMEFFVGAGQLISVQSGLGFVNFFVPQVGQITPLTHFFMLLSVMIFLSLNGHLIIFKMIIDYPVTHHVFEQHAMQHVLFNFLQYASTLFEGIVMLAMAIMIAIMMSNCTLAVMTKFSPQLNIFSIGINISLLISFFIIYLSFDILLEDGNILFNQVMASVNKIVS